jgi:hypothetical protein
VTATATEAPTYFAVPLDLTTENGAAKLTLILQQAAAHPQWFGVSQGAEERAQSAYWMLTHPEHLVWEVWRGGDMVGILLLWRITPKVDALLHFVFFDKNLVGKVRLLRRFLRTCFEDLGFQRISMEVPEDIEKLVSFARRKLAFRYEGESAVRSHPLIADLERATGRSGNPHTWAASVGSRRERAHWRDGVWHDLICLRLTAPEFREQFPGG